MQKKNQTKADQAKTGNTGNTGKASKTSNTGKNVKAGGGAGSGRNPSRNSARPATRDQREAEGCRDPVEPAEPVQAAADLFGIIGRMVVGELAKAVLPKAVSGPSSPERGVMCQDIVLTDGVRARVCLVDADEVDPLSDRSPLPEPIRLRLLRRRMAKEISDIVDSHLDFS